MAHNLTDPSRAPRQCALPVRLILAWTDGSLKKSCYGGWAAIVHENGDRVVLRGAETPTTSPRMELTAALRAIEHVPPGSEIHLVSDSQYVVNGLTEWLPGWVSRGWVSAAGKPVANRDLWERVRSAEKVRFVSAEWVRGHAGHEMNELADYWAGVAAEESMRRGGGHG